MKSMIVTLTSTLVLAGAAFAAELASMDSDGDGMLSMTELQAAYPTLTEDSFAAIDANGDTMVDEAELQAAVDGGVIPAEG